MTQHRALQAAAQTTWPHPVARSFAARSPVPVSRVRRVVAALSVAGFALAGCAAVGVPGSGVPGSGGPDSPVSTTPVSGPTDAAPASPGSSSPAAPSVGSAAPGEVLAQGTVLAQGDSLPQLCLGGVAESYPPQCSGPDLLNWDWDAVEQSETASGVTWGAYAVQGTWDGTAFTRTADPIPLSLYDPLANPDPRLDPSTPGAGVQADLERLQQELHVLDPALLGSSVSNGYLFVTVVYDDGTLQEHYDSRYGPDLIAVQSALQPIP